MCVDDSHLTYADNDSFEGFLNRHLNITKFEFMLIGSRQKLNSLSALPALEINGTQLNRINFIKSLGVLIDEN